MVPTTHPPTPALHPPQGDFAPSDLLCPHTQCWVPLDRARAALEAAPTSPLTLAELPGALEGLGPEHRVEGGHPTSPPRRPTLEELGSQRMLLVARGRGGGSGGVGRVRRTITLAQLLGRGLPPEVAARLVAVVGEWAEQVGPEARQLIACKC